MNAIFEQRTITRWGAMVLAAGFLCSCAAVTGYPKPYQDTAAVITWDQPYLSADVRTNASADDKAYRDKVVYARLEVIDINYYAFESKLMADYDGLGLGSDLTTLLLSGLGATTGSSATKAALASASAGIIGANGAVNTDVFYKKTLPSLIAEMRAARQSALVPITSGLTHPTSEYPLAQALADVNGYYIAGTIPSAISAVTAQAGSQLDSANKQLALIRMGPYVEPAKGSSAAQIRAWLYPGGDETKPPNMGNLQKLATWMNNDKTDILLSQIPYQSLLTGSGLINAEADRIRAIKDLNIPMVAP